MGKRTESIFIITNIRPHPQGMECRKSGEPPWRTRQSGKLYPTATQLQPVHTQPVHVLFHISVHSYRHESGKVSRKAVP